MFGLYQKTFWCLRFSTVAICLFALLLSNGCAGYPFAKKPRADTLWICDKAADAAMDRKDYETGIVLHERLLEKDPQNGLARYHLGYAYGQTGDHLREAENYEKAISVGFHEGHIYFNLGMAYGELDETDKSVRAFKKAVDLDPGNADYHFGLAEAYKMSLANQSAEAEYLKAIELDPGHLEARLSLSLLYADMGRLEKAKAQLRKILEMDPTHASAREFLQSIEKE